MTVTYTLLTLKQHRVREREGALHAEHWRKSTFRVIPGICTCRGGEETALEKKTPEKATQTSTFRVIPGI